MKVTLGHIPLFLILITFVVIQFFYTLRSVGREGIIEVFRACMDACRDRCAFPLRALL